MVRVNTGKGDEPMTHLLERLIVIIILIAPIFLLGVWTRRYVKSRRRARARKF